MLHMTVYDKIVFKVIKHLSGVRRRYVLSLVKQKGKGVQIGNYTVIQNADKLALGDYTQISDFTVMLALNKVSIGKNCRISTSCMITSVTHKIGSYNRINDDVVNKKNLEVIIGDNVWIGANCVVLPGVTIGDNSVIGAGSIVKTLVPADEVWAGSPAVFISKINFNGHI